MNLSFFQKSRVTMSTEDLGKKYLQALEGANQERATVLLGEFVVEVCNQNLVLTEKGVEEFLERGARLNSLSCFCYGRRVTPLFYACYSRQAETVSVLLNKGADPNARDELLELGCLEAVLIGNEPVGIKVKNLEAVIDIIRLLMLVCEEELQAEVWRELANNLNTFLEEECAEEEVEKREEYHSFFKSLYENLSLRTSV
jgi:hypothetical protein